MNKKLKTVLNVMKSPCAGAPGNLNECLNKYSYYNSKVYCEKSKISISDFSCDYKDNVPRAHLQQEIDNADLIHFHNCSLDQFNRFNFENKPFIIQLHSEPRTKSGILQKYRNVCITIAQKHATLYKSPIYTVPNIFDSYDERYLPEKKSEDKVVIFYSATSVCKHSDYTNTCAGKGYEETIDILNKIKKQYKDSVEIRTFLKTAKLDVLEAKRTSDIVIDECVTGGYHLTSLEGLSMGCIVINALNDKVEDVFRNISDYKEYELPFDVVNINLLYDRLCKIIQHKFINLNNFKYWQKNSRDFMENYWHPAKMIKWYEKKYDEMLGLCSNPYEGLRYSSDLERVRKDRNKVKKQYNKGYVLVGSLKDEHKNKPALILGMGNSVNKVDLTKHFENDIVFACNYYFKKFPNLNPDVWSCIDSSAFRDIMSKNVIPKETTIIANYPVSYVDVKNDHVFWLTNNLIEYNENFKSKIEIERPYTVATIMLMNAIYMGCNPIYIVGIDLSLSKSDSNYCYNDKAYNNKFRPFNNNYLWIMKEFKKLRHEAEIRGIKIYNLDHTPQNFDVFDVLK